MERVSKHGHEHPACCPSFETALRASLYQEGAGPA